MGTWRFHNVTQSANFMPFLGSVTITNQQPCQLATFDGEMYATEPIAEGDEVAVYYADDNVTEVKVFAGDVSVVTDAHEEPGGTPALLRFSARDFTARLDDTILTSKRSVSESATARVNWIMSQGNDFGIGTSGVASISDTIDAFDYTTQSRREALSQVAGVVAAVFYVDFNKELQFYPYDTVISAAFDLVTPASPPTSYGYRNFTMDRDVTDEPDVIFVQGDGVSRWVPNAPGGTDKARAVTASGVKSTAMLEKIGAAELLRTGTEQQSGSLETMTPGLNSGETVHITNPGHSINADFIISSVGIRPFMPNGGDTWNALYSIDFADRLLCIPQIDTTRDTTITKDPTDPGSTPCDECQRRVVLTAIDSAISMTSSAKGNIHLYDGTKLVKYTCSLDIIDSNDSAATTLGYIRHEPGTHTSLSTGDEGLYGDPSQGDYGTTVYDISGDITPVSVDVSDRATFWVTTGVGGASELDEEFTGGGSTDDWGSGLSTRWIGEITSGTPTWGVASGAGWVQGGTGDTSVALNAYTRHGTVDVDWPDTYVNNNGGGGGASTDHTGWPTDSAWTQTDWEMEARFRVIDKTADTAIWLLNYKGFGAASANNNSVYIEPDGGEYSIVDKGGGLDSTTITLTDSAWYGIRWQRIGAHARVRIWLYSGAEPSSWDLDVAKGSTVYSDFQLDHVVFDDARVEWDYIRFFYAADGGLEYRSEEDGTLLASATLAVAPESSRRTPDGQHIFVQQGNDSLVRYNRNLELEDTVTVSGFFPVQDWNCDDQFNLERMSGNVLYRYHADGSLAWSTDLNAAEGYRFPSLAPSGGNGLQVYTGRSSGNGAMADGYIRVVGYRGGATWTTGESDAMLLIIRRSDGNVEDVRRWGGLAGDHAQAMAIVAHGSCIYIAGAASGSEFEQLSLSGTQGWVLRAPLGLTGADGGVAGAGLSIGEDV